jgi:BirA family biotin operon repressor/biotin-[acetyl-CoA-carboxylase] ligase
MTACGEPSAAAYDAAVRAPGDGPPGPWTDLERPPLRAPALRRALTEPHGGSPPAWRAVEVVPSIASTNAEVASRALAGEAEGLVLVADHQSAGRGRLGRSWVSPPGAGLAISVLLRPGESGAGVPVSRWSWIGLLAGVAAVQALTRTCGLPARLKWPNDVLVPVAPGGPAGKVAGILAEVVPGASGPQAVVLGVGINVSQQADELPTAESTSLRLAGSATTDRDTVLRAFLRALAAEYRRWTAAGGDPRRSGVGAAYREACATIGSQVRVELPSEVVEGLADGIDDDGHLLLWCDGAVRTLTAGDVVHVRPAPTG